MRFIRAVRQVWILSLAVLWLGGCIAVPKQAFDSVHHPDIRSIAIADVEYNHKLTIRRYNPVYAMIGASGLLMQQVAMDQKSSRYKARVGDLASTCEHLMLQEVQSGLLEKDYRVRLLHTDFWQAMKLAHAHRLPGVDAVLRPRIERLGFRAGSVSAPYEPSLMISVQLIGPTGREVLYEDTIAIGYKPSGYRMTILDYDRQPYSYPTLAGLLDHAGQSKQVLFIALQHAAERISHDLGRKHAPILVEAARNKPASLKN